MDLKGGLGHLSYSTLVHPGDTWAEMRESMSTYLPEVKKRFSPDAPFGVSLRLSGASVETLMGDPGERAELAKFLDQQDMYLYTVNAFPYGPFKGQRVKEQVYEPDWADERRVRYTMDIADILAEVCAEGVEPSIQSAPLAFAANVSGPDYVETLTRNTLRVVAHLFHLEQRTGRRVKLALEPEPFCYLETTDETVTWFTDHVYSAAGIELLSELADIPLAESIGALRRYLGVVFDICHQSVAFENMTESLAKLEAAGIPVFKLQEASALWVPEVTEEAIAELGRFTDTIYLSQTSEVRDGVLTRYLNLEDAIAAYRADPGPREWRTHFHVPVFLDDLGPFRTTRFGVQEALLVHAAKPQSTHLEIETYTWDVLPDHLKTGDIIDYVVRELEFVRDTLLGAAEHQ
ncbi:metabolite traffic protein EboE [Acidothermaceae bacterium B102]|nr:metabolite traffic protein EboE [Acidothermaceae bacterium B102]